MSNDHTETIIKEFDDEREGISEMKKGVESPKVGTDV